MICICVCTDKYIDIINKNQSRTAESYWLKPAEKRKGSVLVIKKNLTKAQKYDTIILTLEITQEKDY